MTTTRFPDNLRALIIGSEGALGQAFCELLRNQYPQSEVVGLHRRSDPALDLSSETSLQQAAASFAGQRPFDLLIYAAGVLHTAEFMPEKKLAQLNQAQLQHTLMINAIAPALVLRYFQPLLSEQGSMAFLSARVGSIGDNRLGGWYSYRASKAALNMLIKTAAIEIQRSRPQQTVLALHPGTVQSRLSQPFHGGAQARPASVAAAQLLAVIAQKGPAESGGFFSYDGSALPW